MSDAAPPHDDHRDSGHGDPTYTDPAHSALDAEVDVRIEVGQVSMTAKDWSELRPGDVVETDRPIGASVRLYAGGASALHGELVDVEGRIGVRITGFGK